jgi:hypothetical protein
MRQRKHNRALARSTGRSLSQKLTRSLCDRLWTLKNAILEFFKRLTSATWDRSSRQILLGIRVILVATFIAVVISDLAECQPFSHYWQVVPDPGGRCRQGYAQLLTMAVCNIVTDLLLVCFPVPIIIKSQMSLQRKIQLILLFSMSLPVVACTLYRVPNVIFARGSQQTRSLIASVEIMFATAAANALVLGSFVRDRGVKKKRFKYGSVAESMERSEGSRSRRPTAIRHWGSDEDLVRDLGLGVEPGLRDIPEDPAAEASHAYTPAGPAPTSRMTEEMRMWRFNQNKYNQPQSDDSIATHDHGLSPSQTNTSITPRRVSFFDVGGLLSPGEGGDSGRRPSHHSGVDPLTPNPSLPASPTGLRRGSTAFLQDIGGLLGPSTPRAPDPAPRARGDALQRPHTQQSIPNPRHAPGGGAEAVLADVGGLLGPPRGSS